MICHLPQWQNQTSDSLASRHVRSLLVASSLWGSPAISHPHFPPSHPSHCRFCLNGTPPSLPSKLVASPPGWIKLISDSNLLSSHAPELLLLSLLPCIHQCFVPDWQHPHTLPPDPIGRGRLVSALPIKF